MLHFLQWLQIVFKNIKVDDYFLFIITILKICYVCPHVLYYLKSDKINLFLKYVWLNILKRICWTVTGQYEKLRVRNLDYQPTTMSELFRRFISQVTKTFEEQ